MSTASSVLIAADHPTTSTDTPRYTLLLSTDPELIDAAQRLRHDVFTSEPGFALAGATDGRDADRFDEYCDHLLVREDNSGELVGCYRMLPPPGAIAAGGLYTATEFDVGGLDALRPELVEMGRAVVREDHRNGGVVLLMWAGILAYLDRCNYVYVTGCVSVPVRGADDETLAARSAACATSCGADTPRPNSTPCTRIGRSRSTARASTTSIRRAGWPFRRSCADTFGSAPRCAANLRTTRTSGSATSRPCSTSVRPTFDISAGCGRWGSARDGRRMGSHDREHAWVPRATCGAVCIPPRRANRWWSRGVSRCGRRSRC